MHETQNVESTQCQEKSHSRNTTDVLTIQHSLLFCSNMHCFCGNQSTARLLFRRLIIIMRVKNKSIYAAFICSVKQKWNVKLVTLMCLKRGLH